MANPQKILKDSIIQLIDLWNVALMEIGPFPVLLIEEKNTKVSEGLYLSVPSRFLMERMKWIIRINK